MQVWINILKDLQAKLILNKTAKIIKCGALSPDDFDLSIDENNLQGAIFLIRDREYKQEVKNMHNDKQGIVSFFVENWIRCDDTDPLKGYEILAEQENSFFTSLDEYILNHLSNDFCILDCNIEETIGDADSKRPLV